MLTANITVYHITGNFQGRKHSRIGRKRAFVEKILMECIILCETYEELLEQSNLPSLETACKMLPSLQIVNEATSFFLKL